MKRSDSGDTQTDEGSASYQPGREGLAESPESSETKKVTPEEQGCSNSRMRTSPHVTSKHTPAYAEERASGSLLYEAGRSKPVLRDDLEGWDWVGRGKEVWRWDWVGCVRLSLTHTAYGRNQYNTAKPLPPK